MNKQKIKLLVVFSLILVVFSVPSWSWAATLYLDPAEGEFSQGETFIEEIKLDTEGEDINAVKVNLTYQKDILEIVDFSDGGSVLKLWVERPTINNQQTTDNEQQGVIFFTGGVPNGFRGEGLIGKIIFKTLSTTNTNAKDQELISGNSSNISGNLCTAKIKFLQGTQILLNDGLGTPAKLTTKEANFKISAKESEIKNGWQEVLEEDNIPPEPFKIVISKDPSIFEGKYFITFWTQDKQSGIDHYEVKEGEWEWQEVTSPYLLRDQSLRSIIRVKAIDKAGNEKVEIAKPTSKIFLNWIVFVGIILIVGWAIYRFKNKILIKSPK